MRLGDRRLPVTVVADGEGASELEIAGARVKLSGWPKGQGEPPSTVVVDGERIAVLIEERRGGGGAPARAAREGPPGARPAPSAGPGAIVPPMPGRVVELRVREGEHVAIGQPLLILEAMKMRNEILAPHAGTVRGLRVAAGANVAKGETMLTVVPDAGTAGPRT